MNSISGIIPTALAAKLADASNLVHPAVARELEVCPRLIEALWHIQWRSFQPGGLPKFIEELVAALPQYFVTACMADYAEDVRGGVYSWENLIEVWHSFPDCAQLEEAPVDRKLLDLMRRAGQMNQSALHRDGMDRTLRQTFTPEFFAARCRDRAVECLPQWLMGLCVKPEMLFAGRTHSEWAGDGVGERGYTDLWFITDLQEALFKMMDAHAQRTLDGIAHTSIVKQILDDADFARFSSGLVVIKGEPRLGKTEPLRTLAEAYPGRWRYFAVPPPNALGSLHRAQANSFGLSYRARSGDAALEEQINYILHNGRIGIIADEGHWIVPTRKVEPRRLNWFRTQIVDKGTPCLLSITPQFDKELTRHVGESNYRLEQWVGRVALERLLPDDPTEQDLLAVARHHLPGMDRTVLLRCAGRAKASPQLLAALKHVGQRARWYAAKEGREVLSVEDVNKAMADCLPSGLVQRRPAAGAVPAPKPREARESQADRPRSSQPRLNLPPVRRPGSLESAVPEAEFAPAD